MQSLGAPAIRCLVEAFQATPLYREYQQAFRRAPGMSMMLRLPDTDEMLSAAGRAGQNEFCTVMTGSEFNYGACGTSCHAVKLKASTVGASSHCFAHMSISTLPIVVGNRIIAYLWTSQVFAPGVREAGFCTIDRMLRKAGAGDEEIDHQRELWEATPEVTAERYENIVTLLRVFARQPGNTAAGLLLTATPSEPKTVRRASHYVRDHLADRMALEEAATPAGLSPHHFLRIFRSATGLTLTDYSNRSCIESARHLLLKADARVSEIACEVGYQSLSQCNRSFLRITDRSPLEYRRRILRPTVLQAAS